MKLREREPENLDEALGMAVRLMQVRMKQGVSVLQRGDVRHVVRAFGRFSIRMSRSLSAARGGTVFGVGRRDYVLP